MFRRVFKQGFDPHIYDTLRHNIKNQGLNNSNLVSFHLCEHIQNLFNIYTYRRSN